MATKKVTVTLKVDQLNAILALVQGGSSKSVSAFVQHAVTVALGDVAGWGALLAEALAQSGGQLTRAERNWADGLLSPKTARPARKRRKAA